jgi:hypothetical protein
MKESGRFSLRAKRHHRIDLSGSPRRRKRCDGGDNKKDCLSEIGVLKFVRGLLDSLSAGATTQDAAALSRPLREHSLENGRIVNDPI